MSLFGATDLVLAPHQRHVGSSGILLRAAAAGVPLLTQKYGAMGETVRAWKLGITVDTGNPSEIARALERFLGSDPLTWIDRHSARRLAEANTPKRFAATVFESLSE